MRRLTSFKLVRRVDFFGLVVTFAKIVSSASADVIGRPDLNASAILLVSLIFQDHRGGQRVNIVASQLVGPGSSVRQFLVEVFSGVFPKP